MKYIIQRSGVIFMRRRHDRGNIVGYVSIFVGGVILLSLILPPGFWWFAIGAGLVAFGIWLNNRYCC